MKKDKINSAHTSKSRLRVASINHLLDKSSDTENPRGLTRSRSEEEKDSDLPQFYHHPRRPRNFDPL